MYPEIAESFEIACTSAKFLYKSMYQLFEKMLLNPLKFCNDTNPITCVCEICYFRHKDVDPYSNTNVIFRFQ